MYSFATNVDVGPCGKQCAWYDVFCHWDKSTNNCGGAYWDPLFGVGQTDKERLLQHGITYAEPDYEGNVQFTTPTGTSTGKVDCAHECGSFFSPIEWGCYLDKMMGGCGGSTGICDIIGGGEGCLEWGKWAVVGVIILLLALVISNFGRRSVTYYTYGGSRRRK